MTRFSRPKPHFESSKTSRSSTRESASVFTLKSTYGWAFHSGAQVAVVGEVGPRCQPGSAEPSANPVNLAARIQSFAQLDTVVVSASTAKLIDGYFELQSLDARSSRLHASGRALSRRTPDRRADQTRGDRAARADPLVGRDKESEEMAVAWKDVQDGADRVLVVRGEAGIGKSRIVHHFRHTTLAEGAGVLECFCSPLTQATAFAPLIEMLDARVVERAKTQGSPTKLDALASMLGEHSRFGTDAVPLIAALLSIPGADEAAIHDLSPVRRRARTLEILREWMAWSAERLPLRAPDRRHSLGRSLNARLSRSRHSEHPGWPNTPLRHESPRVPRSLAATPSPNHRAHATKRQRGRSNRHARGRRARPPSAGDTTDRRAERRSATFRRGGDQDGARIGCAPARRKSIRARWPPR